MSGTNIDRLMETAQDFVEDGVFLTLNGKGYGYVDDFFSISESGSTRVILETSFGKRVDLASVLAYFSQHRLLPVFPDGTTYAQYLARPKSLYRYQVMCPANIKTNL